MPLFTRILPSLQPVANAADEESILDPNCRRLVPQALSVCALKANRRLGSNALAAIGHRAAADNGPLRLHGTAMACTSENQHPKRRRTLPDVPKGRPRPEFTFLISVMLR